MYDNEQLISQHLLKIFSSWVLAKCPDVTQQLLPISRINVPHIRSVSYFICLYRSSGLRSSLNYNVRQGGSHLTKRTQPTSEDVLIVMCFVFFSLNFHMFAKSFFQFWYVCKVCRQQLLTIAVSLKLPTCNNSTHSFICFILNIYRRRIIDCKMFLDVRPSNPNKNDLVHPWALKASLPFWDPILNTI